MIQIIQQQLKLKNPLLIDLKVTPKSKNNQLLECFEQLNGRVMLKVKIQGAPEKGKVNQELLKFLSNQLDLPKSHLQLVAGLTSRNKVLQINQ
jgi:hypothetical protein